MPRRPTMLILASVALAAGCDPQAKASGQESAARAGSAAAYETCSSTTDCGEGLRCSDSRCIPSARSRLGDYHAAVGRRALTQGAINEAVAAYNQAVTEYESAELEPPAALYCGQGQALVSARMDPQKAEAAARVLHRCLLGVAGGSALYHQALDNLAILGEVGLEPELLSRDEPADLYLTRQPKKPPLDRLTLLVEGDKGNRRDTFTGFLEALGSDEAKAKLAPCWEAHWKETRNETMSVTLPFQYRLRLHEDDPALDKAFLTIDDYDEPSDPAAAAATECVRSVAEEIAEDLAAGFKADHRWNEEVTITLADRRGKAVN